MSKEKFEDFVEEHLEVTPEFEKRLNKAMKDVKTGRVKPLKEIL